MLTQSEGLLSSSCHPDSKEAGGSQDEAGTQTEQLTQIGKRDVLYHMLPCSAIKAEVKEEKERKGGHSEQWHLSPQETITHDEPCLPGSEQR